jgi:hypothetical protein
VNDLPSDYELNTISADRIAALCTELAEARWASAQLVLDHLHEFPRQPAQLARAKAASLAGIYELRLRQDPGLSERTLDLARFAETLHTAPHDFIHFFPIQMKEGRALVAVTENLQRPLASTVVRGTGMAPQTSAANASAIDTLPSRRAAELCETLTGAGWQAAPAAMEMIASSSVTEFPVWLATPQTLARHYSEQANEPARLHIDANRFAQAMSERNPREKILIFHLFDPYGWQITCAITEDFSAPIAVAARRRGLPR